MADTWEALRAECAACRGCALADTRTNVVFGDGSETAEIMLIGEGPGQHEATGVPVPRRLAALRGKPRRFDKTVEKQAIETAVLDFLK